MEELDRHPIGPRFAAWLDRWRERWLAGDQIRILVALDGSHAVAVADPDAPAPGPCAQPVPLQLELALPSALDDAELAED